MATKEPGYEVPVPRRPLTEDYKPCTTLEKVE